MTGGAPRSPETYPRHGPFSQRAKEHPEMGRGSALANTVTAVDLRPVVAVLVELALAGEGWAIREAPGPAA